MPTPHYKYNEGKLMEEALAAIDATYKGHYSAGPLQPGELMIALGIGRDYFIGNIIKYAARYGKKGGYNRQDLLKAVHYAIMALHDADVHAELSKNENKCGGSAVGGATMQQHIIQPEGHTNVLISTEATIARGENRKPYYHP
jgi:hypothetical protein